MKKILLIITLVLLTFQIVVLATAIDIGEPAIDRDAYYDIEGRTFINKGNPANESGKITSVELYFAVGSTGVEVATFFVVSGNNLSTRDHESIGNVSAGSKQTFTVDLDVQAGDYIGVYCAGGSSKIEYYASGGSGIWSQSGDRIPCTNQVFTLLSGRIFSLYGTGTTAEEEDNATFFGMNF